MTLNSWGSWGRYAWTSLCIHVYEYRFRDHRGFCHGMISFWWIYMYIPWYYIFIYFSFFWMWLLSLLSTFRPWATSRWSSEVPCSGLRATCWACSRTPSKTGLPTGWAVINIPGSCEWVSEWVNDPCCVRSTINEGWCVLRVTGEHFFFFKGFFFTWAVALLPYPHPQNLTFREKKRKTKKAQTWWTKPWPIISSAFWGPRGKRPKGQL